MVLPTLLAALGAAMTPTPTQDPGCPKNSHPIEQLVCSDAALAQQDKDMVRLYTQAMQRLDASERARQETRQGTWLAARNACGEAQNPRQCVADLYSRRIIEIKIRSGLLTPSATANYYCKGAPGPVSAAYYASDPPSALVSFADQQAVAFVAASGSGARYTSDDVELWEHQGQATVKWNGRQMVCSKR